MNVAHADFLQDPEAYPSHADQCAACRAIVERLDASVAADGIRLDRLPLAGWEGSAYRSWGFVAAVSVIIAAIAIALCHVAGITPFRAVESDVSISQWRTLLSLLTGTLKHATLALQIVFGALFVAVNTLLFVLLRRPPRGIDA